MKTRDPEVNLSILSRLPQSSMKTRDQILQRPWGKFVKFINVNICTSLIILCGEDFVKVLCYEEKGLYSSQTILQEIKATVECPVQVKEEVNFVYEQESFVKNHNVRDERTEGYLNFVMAIDTFLKNIV